MEELQASVGDHSDRQADGRPAVQDLADPRLQFELIDLWRNSFFPLIRLARTVSKHF
jgi:hypothetical protein